VVARLKEIGRFMVEGDAWLCCDRWVTKFKEMDS
jgi:hypothetical protein